MISILIGSLKVTEKNDALKYAESNNIPVTSNEKSTLNKATNNPSKMTLGDNDVLKNLAEKFNKQNSKQ